MNSYYLSISITLIVLTLHWNQHITHGFIMSSSSSFLSSVQTDQYSLLLKLSQSNNNMEDNNNNENNPFKDFNPFEKKKVQNLNPIIASNNNISLRQLRMKELMNTLLQNVSFDYQQQSQEDNQELLRSILEENSELILEPLNDDHCVMNDEESIYDPGMTREERYVRYDMVMEERIEKATNKSVKRILTVMKEYVSSQK